MGPRALSMRALISKSRASTTGPLGLRYAVVYTSIFWALVFVGSQWAVAPNKA
jgi:hypothetical protein